MVYNISNKGITQIACGWNHTLVFVEPYYVYAAGLSKYGELGLKDFEMRRSFTLIEGLAGKNVVEIFAGGYHSWFLFQYDEPDIDYEPPSPLLTTPVHSINEEEPINKRPKSHDSDNPRRKKFTLEEKNEINEKRNINIRSDDDLKRFEELLKGPRFVFGPETQDDNFDKFKQGRRTFDVLNPPPQSVKKNKTPVVRSPYTEEVNRGKKFNDIYMQTTDFGSKFGMQDNYNKKQIPLTPRSKFHQNVDEDPEMIIPGYQPISSDDDNREKPPPPKSPIKDKNEMDAADAGNFNFKGPKNQIAPIEVSDDENPPSINESDHTPSQKSYGRYEQEEQEEQYYEEGDEQDPSDDSNKDPWIRKPYKPQGHLPTFEPPSKNIAINPPRFNTEDDVSDSQENYNEYKDRKRDDYRRNTANVPVQPPRQNQKRFKPQLTDDFGSDGEFNPSNSNPEQDEYAKLSRKMQNLLDKSKSDRSRKDNQRNDYGDQPDDRDAFKKQRGKKEVFQPIHSDEDVDNDKFGGKRRPEKPEDEPYGKKNRGGRGSESQGLYRSGPGEEFRGSFSQKPSKSDQFFDEFDQKNKNQRPKRKEPARINEHDQEDEESAHSLEEEDYRAVKDPRQKGGDGRDKRFNQEYDRDRDRGNRDEYSDKNLDRQNSKGPKGYDSNDRGQKDNRRYEAPVDNNTGYNRRGEEVRRERNIFILDFRLFFVDLKYCHRFAIMTCNAKDNQKLKSTVEDIIIDLKQNDPQIQVSNFLPIEEFYEKDKSNFLTALGIVPGHGVNSYVLMMVSLPENYVNFQRQRRIAQTNYKEYKAAQSSIGPSFELSEAQIIEDARLKLLSNWYLTLKQHLWNKTTSLRFLELRPSIYK